MKHFLIPAALVLVLASLNSCTQLTQTARLAEGPVVLGVDTIRAHVDVDTTTSLIGMASTTHILGFIRLGNQEFADYPGLNLGLAGGHSREKRAAVYQALDGTNADVLVNPKYIVREQRAFFFSKTTVQVAGFGGKFIFE